MAIYSDIFPSPKTVTMVWPLDLCVVIDTILLIIPLYVFSVDGCGLAATLLRCNTNKRDKNETEMDLIKKPFIRHFYSN